MRKNILFAIVIVALIGSSMSVANAFHYTYELTSNYSENDVPLGATVTVTATTNDPNAYKLVFMWLNPADKVEIIESEFLTWDGSTYIDDLKALTATSELTLDKIGDWDVYAVFLDKFGKRCFSVIIPVKIRHATFNVIPEIPIIGTAGAAIAMVAGLTYKVKRTPSQVTS